MEQLLQLILRKKFLIIYVCHLTMHLSKQKVVAIGISGIGTGHCLMIAFKRAGHVAKVTIYATQQIVSKHLLIVSAVAVEIICHTEHHTV